MKTMVIYYHKYSRMSNLYILHQQYIVSFFLYQVLVSNQIMCIFSNYLWGNRSEQMIQGLPRSQKSQVSFKIVMLSQQLLQNNLSIRHNLYRRHILTTNSGLGNVVCLGQVELEDHTFVLCNFALVISTRFLGVWVGLCIFHTRSYSCLWMEKLILESSLQAT